MVFAGTVLALDAQHTQVAVEAWYVGEDPDDVVWVFGGREQNAITSVDWNPATGERVVVVAESTPDGGLVTATCQQSSAIPDLGAKLEIAYGTAEVPPFPPDPSGSPAPSGAPASPAGSPSVVHCLPTDPASSPISPSADPGSSVHEVEASSGPTSGSCPPETSGT